MTDKAAIYAATDTIIPLEKLYSIVGHKNIATKRKLLGPISQFKIASAKSEITINVMETERIPSHLQGFSGYIAHLVNGNFDARNNTLLQRIAATQQVLGMVIEPGWDLGGKNRQIVLGIASAYDGLIFAANSIYDHTGKLVIGPPGASHILPAP